jgi:triosephosphate isomerase
MLAGLCDYVIIGHSERRQYFAESGELINKKLKSAMKFNLKPILCVGEKLEQNEAGQTRDVVSGQLKSALDGIEPLNGLVLAYEPVWAIGTGKAATDEQANQTIDFIRRTVARLYNDKVAQETRILYGGSVTAANIAEFARFPDIDGGLVGGASLKAAEFIGIVTQTAKIKS